MCLISKNCIIILLFLNYVIYIKSDQLKIWGPGLKPKEIVMPARYFFLKNISNDTNQDLLDLNVKISGSKIQETNYPCRIWTNILNRKDDSYIIRYKLYEPCLNLKISVTIKEKHIDGFPMIFKGITYSEDCNCELHSMESFLDKWDCGEIHKKIKENLRNFQDINFDLIRNEIISKYNKPYAISLCSYVVKNNLVYRKCYGEHVGFKMFMDNILLSLTRKMFLPDLEFFVNLGDWPLTKYPNENIPILSWCGSKDSLDIVMPTYDITESTLENMGRVMLDMLSVQGNVKETWENRIPKVFWRGRDSSRERLKLIEMSREYPNLFNVSITNFFFFRNEMEKYGPSSKHVSFYDFFDYKYQVNLDGTVAAYRFPYLLAGGSLVFKQESKYYEFFYDDLRPDVHYISIKKDLSDLIEKIKWATENDKEVQKIGQSGREFANKNLLPKNIFCYHVQLFNEFSKKLISPVEILEGMELVKFSKEGKCNCDDNVKDEL